MNYQKIVIPTHTALEIMKEYNFSDLYKMVPSIHHNKMEPLLIVFFYGLTYANTNKQKGFMFTKREAVGSGEYSDGEPMEWSQPIIKIDDKLLNALSENQSIKIISDIVPIINFDNYYHPDPEDWWMPLSSTFELKPSKKVIDEFLNYVYYPHNNLDINDPLIKTKNWIFD